MERIMKIDCNGKIDILESNTDDIRTIVKKDLSSIFEIVRPRGLNKDFFMLVDENGYEKNSAINIIGCELYQTYIHGVPILGPIYIVRNKYNELSGLSNEDIRFFLSELKDKIKHV